jgi:hypothetical protein
MVRNFEFLTAIWLTVDVEWDVATLKDYFVFVFSEAVSSRITLECERMKTGIHKLICYRIKHTPLSCLYDVNRISVRLLAA